MAIRSDGPAPYGPPGTIIRLIEGFRDRGLATPFTGDVLARAGVSGSLINRTLQSLRQLELIDDDGAPTEQFEVLRRARGDEEYKARLAEWVEGVYADVLQFADPRTDAPERVAEAFRGYTPAGQRSRMVTLMLGLFDYAGLIDAPKRPVVTSSPRPIANRLAGAQRRPKPAPKQQVVGSDGGSDLPPALLGLLREVPRNGDGWTQAKRDNFLRAFTAVLDYSVPISAEFDPYTLDEEDADV
jgi:hypothetical protein